MERIEFPKANLVTLRCFRRGHAQDISMSGTGIAEVLKAGGWSSGAWTSYVNMNELEEQAVFEAQVLGSDSESD